MSEKLGEFANQNLVLQIFKLYWKWKNLQIYFIICVDNKKTYKQYK